MVTLGVILIGSLLAPMLSEYTTATKTYTNEGTPYAIFDGESHEIVIAIDEGGVISISTDGEACQIPTGFNNTATIVYAEDGYARIALNGGNTRVFVSNSADGITPTTTKPVTLTIEATGITMTNGTTTYESECSPLAYIASEGPYVLTTKPGVAADSTIYLGGTTNYSSGNYIAFVGYGTTEDITATNAYSSPTSDPTVTISSVSAVATTSKINENIEKIDNVLFTATLSNESTLTGTFTYFLAPATITWDDPDYIGSAGSAILIAIPLMAIAALLLLVVRFFVGRD